MSCESDYFGGETVYAALDKHALQRHVDSVEDQHMLREMIKQQNLVAFVGDGSILPRVSGNSDEPMDSNQAIRFKSPPSMKKEFTLPHR